MSHTVIEPAYPVAATNARAFLWFRILFNCRFYYPVYAVFFLDLGLSVEQFALLNAVWAATIVLLEVPSGALADQIGRRRLVVMSGWLMIAEMLVLCFTPAHSIWTFPLFLLNRVLSGTAEAMASGADEALVYDSLPAADRENRWRGINAGLIRWQSIGFVVSSIIGAMIYDPATIGRIIHWLGGAWSPDKSLTLRLPVLLTLLTGIGALAAAMRLRDTISVTVHRDWRAKLAASWQGTVAAAAWIWRTPAAFALLAIGLFFDSIIRLFYTVASPFYRLIQIPDAWFGFVGAAAALTGIASASIGAAVLRRANAGKAFGLVAVLTLIGCTAFAFPIPWISLLLVAPFWLAMRLLHFFLTHFLNPITPGDQRATVLSFRGLTMNLAYGTLTLAYGAANAWLDKHLPASATGTDRSLEVFAASARLWLPWFVITGSILWLILRRRCGGPLAGAIERSKP